MVDQREELPRLPFGNPIGAVPAASRGVSLIIKFYFVSFVPFVVIFSFAITCFLSVRTFRIACNPFSEQTPSAASGEFPTLLAIKLTGS